MVAGFDIGDSLGRIYGGEGGIQTLGIGVSPYNGLAKHRVHFLPRVFNHFALLECFPVVAGLPQNHLN
jgi:hypothetical protein